MRWALGAAIPVVLIIGVAACWSRPPERAVPAIKFLTSAEAVLHAGTETGVPIQVSDSSATISESGSMPYGLSFQVERHGNAAIVGVAGRDAGGFYRLRLAAVDGSRRASQVLTLSVDEMPWFPSLDVTTFRANEHHGNQIVIFATGYPMPQLSYTGTLPHGITLTRGGPGMVMISGSPGSFEGPCSSRIVVHAVGISGKAALPVRIKIGNRHCPWNPADSIDHIVISPVMKAGTVGKWIWWNGLKAAAFVWENGRAFVVSPESNSLYEDG